MSGGIIVLGMHRSGTSLVSEMLHRWGAFGRVEECLPPNRWNARGYWELAPLVDFNNRLLGEVGASWTCPPDAKEDSRLADLAKRPNYRDEALGLLASMKQPRGGTWFWKDPRLSILLPFWQQLWGDVRYVICLRDPFEICRSLRERDDLSFPISILLWQRYMLSILEWTGTARPIVMSYSAMLQDSRGECTRLLRFLQSSGRAQRSAAAVGKMSKAVHQELRHFRANAASEPFVLSKSQRELHETLEQLACCEVTNEKLNLGRYSLPASWRSLLKANLLLLRWRKRWDRLFQNSPAPAAAGTKADLEAISRPVAVGTLDEFD
jgi:hypothetical protein